MTYILHNNRLVAKTREYFNDGMKVYYCYVNKPTDEENQKLLDASLLRKRDDCLQGITSNDPQYAALANELCFNAQLKSQSLFSIECFILEEPPF